MRTFPRAGADRPPPDSGFEKRRSRSTARRPNVFVRVLITVPVACVVSILFVSQAISGWVRLYPGQGSGYGKSQAVAVDDSGFVYVAGNTAPTGGKSEITTIKYTSSGDTVWVRRYGGLDVCGQGWVDAGGLDVDASGNVYVVGSACGLSTYYDMVTIKYSPTGDTLWLRHYNDGFDILPRHLELDAEGNVYVMGASLAPYGRFLTIKYSPLGDTLWTRRYHGPTDHGAWPIEMALDESGHVLITGGAWVDSINSYDIATLMYTPDGDTGWVRFFNGSASGYDHGYAVAVDDSGCVYVTGESTGATAEDYTTIKYSAAGDMIWIRYYNRPGGNGEDIPFDVVVDDAKNVIVTGESRNDVGGFDYLTVKYSLAGDTVWTRRFESPDAIAVAVGVDESGNVFVTGDDYSVRSKSDILTLKYSPEGTTLWQRRYNGAADKGGHATGILVDRDGNVYVMGSADGWVNMATIKYCEVFKAGDITGDEMITSADVIALVNYVFKGGVEPTPCAAAGDVNCTSAITSADIIYLVNHVFKSGPPPCDVCTLIPGTWSCP